MNEWVNAGNNVLVQVQHLANIVPGGANAPFFLNAATLHAGAPTDLLFGDGGDDWFLASSFGQVKDLLNGDVFTDL
jgi:hypothetical protein